MNMPTKSVINVTNFIFRLNYIYEPGRLPPRRQMFYQLVDVQIQQIAEEGFHVGERTLVQFRKTPII